MIPPAPQFTAAPSGGLPPPNASVLAPVRVWAEMVKLSHSVFALPFAMIAAFLAGRNVPARSAALGTTRTDRHVHGLRAQAPP